jgi:hypothetical protein
MTTPAFADRPPDSPKPTAYDERHLVRYLRLLDAAEEGALARSGADHLWTRHPTGARAGPHRARQPPGPGSLDDRDRLSVPAKATRKVTAIFTNLFDDSDGEGYALIWSRSRKQKGV